MPTGKFLLASALLDMGEAHKALDLFIEASFNLRTERREVYLERIVAPTEECSESRLLVTYLLKVVYPYSYHLE